MLRNEYFKRLNSISTEAEFKSLAFEVFRFQSENNGIYSQYISMLNREVNSIYDIPFLPVEFFKSHQVTSTKEKVKQIFTSSGTSGSDTSKHYVFDTDLYEYVFTSIFEKFYGLITDYTILALLPSYLERKGSSLIYMAEKLIVASRSGDSGFYLNEHEKLYNLLVNLQKQKRKTILLGVTYALLDFVAAYKLAWPELIVMETGGMKGKRKESVRDEVHEQLCSGFGVDSIHSEYGMTELLSQAYSKGNGIFHTPRWMKILIRDPYDPLVNLAPGFSGGVNIIDLANIDSCAFIATQDIGKVYPDNSFEILGRFDFSDLRGCNLLVD